MLKVIAEITAPTNDYKDKNTGKTKTFYRKIGSIMENDSGSQFILLDKFFNLAAIDSDPTKANVLLPLNFIENEISHQGHFKTTSPKSDINTPPKQAKKKRDNAKATPEAIKAAKKLLQTDAMMKQSKSAGHVLPFDDELEF